MQVLKRSLKAFLVGLHRVLERLGLHVLPVHYYSALPNRQALAQTRNVWAHASDLPGLDWDLKHQLTNLHAIFAQSAAESDGFDAFERATRGEFGPGFGPIEARVLYAVLRAVKPTRVIEIGAGVSTAVTLAALNRNRTGVVTCIEPYPKPPLRDLPISLIESPVQKVPLSTFTELRANDVLFIDSTHAVRVGGDVNYLVLEVLPRLAPGVFIHFHDIFLPYDHPPDLFESLWSWTETSLVRAYLAKNHSVEVLFCLSALHYTHPAALVEMFPDYHPRRMIDGLYADTDHDSHFPASLWLRVSEDPKA